MFCVMRILVVVVLILFHTKVVIVVNKIFISIESVYSARFNLCFFTLIFIYRRVKVDI